MRPPLAPTPATTKACALVVAAVAITLWGCSRGVYRRAADRQAYSMIGENAKRAGVQAENWEITPGQDSRLHDPSDPDRPLMPVDDPIAAELNHRKKAKTEKGEKKSEPWRHYLPTGKDGVVTLNARGAVLVAARNSRDFQRAREELFLSALDLSEERYRFNPLFDLSSDGTGTGEGTLRGRTADGQPAYSAGVATRASASKLTAFGGEMLVNFANTLLWDFGQPSVRTAGSLLNFSILQPLMRFGGRARTLENLTEAERHLLANVRRFEQYQQSFYLDVVAGRSASGGPVRNDPGIGSAPALLAGTPSGRTGAPRADGLFGLVEEQQRIRNLEANVARLRASLEQLEAAFDAGRASSRLQVFQARQALHNAQSSLLTSRASYQTRLDSFKTELGLPPDLPVALRDEFFEQFSIVDPASTRLQGKVNEFSGEFRDPEKTKDIAMIRDRLAQLRTLERECAERIVVTRADVQLFRKSLPKRERELKSFATRPEIQTLNVELSRFSPTAMTEKVAQIEEQVGANERAIATAFQDAAALEREIAGLDLPTARSRSSEIASRLGALMLELSLNQAASRLEALTLPEIDLGEQYAVEVARSNRLDWMNARAELVDSWRKIDYAANPLMSGVDLLFEGDMGTLGNDSARFDGRTGQLQAGVRIDTPLDRLRERNDYRVAQINYQRARRDYALFEDRVSQSLRNTLRISELSRMNFELRRAALQVALAQVDLARLRLEEPPRPGQVAQIGATTARDLVSALSDLLEAENEFLGLWVGHHVLRMVLDYELGTMAVDSKGRWIEPGAFTADAIKKRLGPGLANTKAADSDRIASNRGSQPEISVQ